VLGFSRSFLARSSLGFCCVSIRYLLVYTINILIKVSMYTIRYMAMKKFMISVPIEMEKVLEKERKERLLETIPETIRVILSEYLRKK